MMYIHAHPILVLFVIRLILNNCTFITCINADKTEFFTSGTYARGYRSVLFKGVPEVASDWS